MSVNWENAETLLDAIDEEGEVGFNMDDYDCGTTRCIAGWAYYLSVGKSILQEPVLKRPVEVVACDYLGLPNTDDTFLDLFAAWAFDSTTPTTDEIRARLKEMDS